MNGGHTRHPLRRIYAAICLLSLASLGVELLLTRIFDVILWPNLSFLIISCAIFGLGLGGLAEVLRPSVRTTNRFAVPAFGFAATVWAIPLFLNAIPFSVSQITTHPVAQLMWFLGLYLVLLVPFFCVGLCICRIFSTYSRDISQLYFWDLAGAAVGTAGIIPLIQPLGPERLLIGAALLALVAGSLLSPSNRDRLCSAIVAAAFVVAPAALGDRYLTLRLHDDKRSTSRAAAEGRLEFSAWDPVSQISLFDEAPTSNRPEDRGRKHLAYDGGTQTTNFFPFDGNFAALRSNLSDRLLSQFWQRGVLVSHYVRRDSGSKVLIIGSAGGQETKAALMYGASDIDGVEMVGTVVRLATGRYADYIGRLFEQPGVHVHIGEGRSFLRASGKRYDIIQIFSNYTTSSVAEGSGALTPSYLVTQEAFDDYFAHLTPDGILHINHMYYPRIITTAAAAWARVDGDDFRRHVLVVEEAPPAVDHLPTILIKRTAWTAAEVADVSAFFASAAAGELPYHVSENPLDPVHSFLPAGFYSAPIPDALVARAPYDIRPVTDDHPFLRFLRRSLDIVKEDRPTGLDRSTAFSLNTQLHGGWLPREWLHLVGATLASVFYGMLFVLAPLLRSAVGRQPWRGKTATLSYFSLIGFAFIAIELVLIQWFMKVIGYPVYAIATVLAVMLLGAAIGSRSSPRVVGRYGWGVAFGGIVVAGLTLVMIVPSVGRLVLTQPMAVRIVATAALTAPLAFFMGMPFPMGMLELSAKPQGAVAWAWSVNGLFTTTGAVLSGLLSLWIGFRATLIVALAAYVAAAACLGMVRRTRERDAVSARLAPVVANVF